MDDFPIDIAEPSYLARLALTSAPFNNALPYDDFYTGGQRAHNLNLLLHLVRATDKIGILIAETGLGKSLLLQTLRLRLGEDIRICWVEANGDITEEQIAEQCLRGFGVVESDLIASTISYGEMLEARLRQLRKLNIRPLLLLDESQNLSTLSLNTITRWLNWEEENEPLLQCVFSATEPLDLEGLADERLEHISLPALTEEGTEEYLNFRLNRAGYKGKPVFSESEIKLIHQQSGGIPAQINQLAHQQLLGLDSLKQQKTGWKGLSLAVLIRSLGFLILAVGLLFLMFYQDEINQWVSSDTESTVVTEQLTLPPDDVTPVIINQTEQAGNEANSPALPAEVTGEEQKQREELSRLLASLPEDEGKPNKPLINGTEDPLSTARHTSGPETVVANKQEDQKQAVKLKPSSPKAPIFDGEKANTNTKVKVKQVPVSPQNKKKVTEWTQHEKWVLKQKSDRYTVQLLGSRQRSEVEKVIKTHQLSGEVAILETENKGKAWYILIYGVFKNKEAALLAQKSWPAPLNRWSIWPRRFDSVQAQIKNKAASD